MTTQSRRRLWRIDLDDVHVEDEHHNSYEVVVTRGVLDGTLTVTIKPRRPTWYDLNKAAGLTLDDTKGDGVGRYTAEDKAKIIDALWAKADAMEAGEPDV